MPGTFDEARDAALEGLRALNLGEDALVGMRRTADEEVALLVSQGYPRVATGAVVTMAIVKALNSIPAFTSVRLASAVEAMRSGRPADVPIEVVTATMIVLSTSAPDPEWSDAAG